MLVGEQPGDREDVAGKPFVGPAGRLLDGALHDAELDRDDVYLTNAVKHFKWIARGKRRLHQKPSASEIAACPPWLDGEMRLVRAHVIVCLGVTAAQSVLQRKVTLKELGSRPIPGPYGSVVLVTPHPSAILRLPEDAERHEALRRLVKTLREARAFASRKTNEDRKEMTIRT
jgi:DNA polymerase